MKLVRKKRLEWLMKTARERILVLDGAWGVMIQGFGLSEADFRGGRFGGHGSDLKGNNDLLTLTNPEIIREITHDYVAAGADIIETNTFNSTSVSQADYGLSHLVRELNEAGALLAREVCDELSTSSRPRLVAGVLGPTNRTASLSPDVNDPGFRNTSFDELRDTYRDSVLGLISGGADLILIETMSAIFQLLPAIDAARETGLPVFLGIHATPEGTLSSGEALDDLVAELEGKEPDAILLMCRPPEHISAMLPVLRTAFAGPIGGYANVGYEKDPDPTRHQYHSVDQGYMTPVRYAEFCEQWLEQGAQIVGGCCGTTPEHIAAIRPFLASQPQAAVEGAR